MNLTDAASWAQIIWFIGATSVAIYGGFRIWFRIKDKLDNLENYTYKRNGGGSIADSLARIEARNERQDKAMEENTRLTLETVKALSELKGRFNNHIEEGNK
jgi:HAMP domain-containing protein